MRPIVCHVFMSCLVLLVMLDGRAHSTSPSGHGGPITSIAAWRFDDATQGFVTSGFDGRVLLWSAELEAVGEVLHRPYPLEKVTVPENCIGTPCVELMALSPPDDTALKFEKFVHGQQLTVDGDFQAMRDRKSVAKLPADHIIDIDIRAQSTLVIMRNRAPLHIDFASGRQTALPTGGLNAMSGRILASGQIVLGTADGFLTLVDPARSQVVAREQVHTSPILAIDTHSAEDMAITAGADGTVVVWKLGKADLSVERIAAQFQFPILAAVFDEPANRIVVGDKNGSLVAIPLSGTSTMTAPPRPATLFARDTADETNEGKRLFRACAACHSFAADGGNKAGPTFLGLFGRRAGSVPGYPYSRALLNADMVWNETTLSALFQEGPQHYIPGTTMPLQRLPNAKQRTLLIAYLKERDTLSRKGDP